MSVRWAPISTSWFRILSSLSSGRRLIRRAMSAAIRSLAERAIALSSAVLNPLIPVSAPTPTPIASIMKTNFLKAGRISRQASRRSKGMRRTLRSGTRNGRRERFVDDAPVAQVNDTIRPAAERGIVSHNQQSGTFLAVQTEEKIENKLTGRAVQVSRRLVRQ